MFRYMCLDICFQEALCSKIVTKFHPLSVTESMGSKSCFFFWVNFYRNLCNIFQVIAKKKHENRSDLSYRPVPTVSMNFYYYYS